MEASAKKPMRLGALFMVFLTLSVIMSMLAYGYGKVNQAKIDNEFYTEERIGDICYAYGYSKVFGVNNDVNTIQETNSFICLNGTINESGVCLI